MTSNLTHDIHKVFVVSANVSWRLRLVILAAFSFNLLINHSLAYSAEADTSPTKNNASNQINNTHTRTLAASCAACHGSNGNSVGITPALAELDPQYFIVQMTAFKQGTRTGTVMKQHATGLTDLEIDQLAHYFSQQKRVKSLIPPSESFKSDPE